MKITEDIRYIGVKDYVTDLFEGLYKIPDGISYNSYVILDEKIAVMDTVDAGFTIPWLQFLQAELGKRTPDYLIIQHMEPDHSANLLHFMKKYPMAKIVASRKAFQMMLSYFGNDFAKERILVGEGDTLPLGKHTLHFIEAPMVHWPEVIMTYESTDKILFSADAFGKFGASEASGEWLTEARRYYMGIVAKYGSFVQKLLQKLETKELHAICPLHGCVLSENLTFYLEKYRSWASYKPEEEGVLIAYASVYGNTKKAAFLLEKQLKEQGCKKIVLRDLARCDMSETIAEAFRYSKLVLASITYNSGLFPPMRELIQQLIERNFQNRQIALIENGSWAPVAAKIMKESFLKSPGITFAETAVRLSAVVTPENQQQLQTLAKELWHS